MSKVKPILSFVPLMTSVLLLSDFLTQPDILSTVVVRKYESSNNFYVNFQSGYAELTPYQYYVVQPGDSASTKTGKYSDTILSAVIRTKTEDIEIARTYESEYMLVIVGSIGLLSLVGFFDFEQLDARTGKRGLDKLLNVLFPVSTLIGTLMGAKLLLVALGYVSKF